MGKPKAKQMTTTIKKMPWGKFERTIPAAPAKGPTKPKAKATGRGPQVITKYVYVPAGGKSAGGKGKFGGGRQPWKSAGGKFGKPVRGNMVKSKIGKFGKASAKKVSNAISKDFDIDKEARYTGTVVSYHKMKGCGFIKADDEDLVKENLFVYWKSIKSDDRFPSLQKDMKIEFGLAKKKNMNGKWSLCAKQVTLPGGSNIAVQDEVDSA